MIYNQRTGQFFSNYERKFVDASDFFPVVENGAEVMNTEIAEMGEENAISMEWLMCFTDNQRQINRVFRALTNGMKMTGLLKWAYQMTTPAEK